MNTRAYPTNDLDLAGFTRGESEITAKVFTLAAACPARAAADLLGQRAPDVPRRGTRPGTMLAWQTTVDLIRVALRRGTDARTAWPDLPDSDIPRPAAVRAFAIDAADAILDQIGDEVTGWLVMAEPAARIDGIRVRLGGAILLRHRATGRCRLYRARLGNRVDNPNDRDGARWAVIAASSVVATQKDLTEITVTELSLTTGALGASTTWSRDELRSQWVSDIRRRLGHLRDEPARPRPGRHCADCPHAFACPAPHRADRLLGLDGQPWRLVVSADTLHVYARCAHEYALRELYGVPGRRAGSAATDRGRAVHAHLARVHHDGDGCDEERLMPVATDDESVDDPRPYLRNHIEHCPFRGAPPRDVVVEAPIVVIDGDANVVLMGSPDLRYTTIDGQRRWREVKTRPQARSITAERLIDGDITLAVYLLLAGSGVDGDVERLEWEVLSPDGATVTNVPVTAELVARAGAVVRDRIAALLHDDTWSPTTNAAHCTGCAFADICPHSRAT